MVHHNYKTCPASSFVVVTGEVNTSRYGLDCGCVSATNKRRTAEPEPKNTWMLNHVSDRSWRIHTVITTSWSKKPRSLRRVPVSRFFRKIVGRGLGPGCDGLGMPSCCPAEREMQVPGNTLIDVATAEEVTLTVGKGIIIGFTSPFSLQIRPTDFVPRIKSWTV